MKKVIDNTNLGHLISKMKAAFWPKSDIVVKGIDSTPTENSTNLIESGGVYNSVSAKYSKPSSGIPSTDMASAVVTSLGKADTAYQKPSGGIPKADLDSGVKASLDLADSAIQGVPVGGITPPAEYYDYATKAELDELGQEVYGITPKTQQINVTDDGVTTYDKRVFIRPSGTLSTTTDNYTTTKYLLIPEGLKKIEAYCLGNSQYYFGLSYFTSNAYNAFISGLAQVTGQSGNFLVSVNAEDVPATAKYIAITGANATFNSCYVKFYYEENTGSLKSRIVALEDTIPTLAEKDGDAVTGDIAEFDSSGNPVDSGMKAEDVKEALFDFAKEEEVTYTSFPVNGAFLRSSGVLDGTASNQNTTLAYAIPNGIKRIEAVCEGNNQYYYGLVFMASTDVSSFISGLARVTGQSGNFLVSVNADDIPEGANCVRVTGRNNDLGSCYLKFIYDEDNIGVLTQVANLKDEVNKIAPAALYGGITFGRASAASLADGEAIMVSAFPSATKTKDETIVFRANVTAFNAVKVGKGGNTGFGIQYSSWLVIDDTHIVFWKRGASGDAVASKTLAHGLTISTFIYVRITGHDDGSIDVAIDTLGGSFSQTIALYDGDGGTEAWLPNAHGYARAESEGSTLTKCELTLSNKRMRLPLWIFGASYESILDTTSWPYYMAQFGYTQFFLDAFPGRDSEYTYASLLAALQLGTPKYLYWTMWGNGTAVQLDEYIGKVKDICDERGITLIIVNRPNSTAVSSTYSARKAVIDKYIALGVRYVDIAEAVSSDPSSADGWYSGYLAVDGQHPTAAGAKAIARQILADLPEIMQYNP